MGYTDADSDLATACSVTLPANITETQPCTCSAGTCRVSLKPDLYIFPPTGYDFTFTVTANSVVSASATVEITQVKRAFVGTWIVANGDTLRLPLPQFDEAGGELSYNFTVDWGDGEISRVSTWDDSSATHTYSSANPDNIVLIAGELPAWNFLEYNSDSSFDMSRLHLKILNQLGDVGWRSLYGAFTECHNLIEFYGRGDTSAVSSMMGMFKGNLLQTVAELSNLDTSNVIDMSYMFAGAPLVQPAVAATSGGWDTRNVRDMSYMFSDASAANPYVREWDTRSVQYFTSMFENSGFNISGGPYFDGGTWSFASVVDASNMFSGIVVIAPYEAVDQLLHVMNTTAPAATNITVGFEVGTCFTGAGQPDRDALLARTWILNGLTAGPCM